MKSSLNRYIWLIDTLRSRGRLTRERLNQLYEMSPISEGRAFSRRTFYNYREDIADLFGIQIEYDSSTYEYYIPEGNDRREGVTDWLLNSAAMSNVMAHVADVSDRVFLEDVPSARKYLSQVITALRSQVELKFTYRPYTRTTPTTGVIVEPYFLKIFRQRWYVTGRNVKDNRIKTYALDRMESVTLGDRRFELDPSFDVEEYVNDTYGIIFTKGEPKDITIRTDPRQAKYLRALPLHHSQSETIHDTYSLFHYRLRLTEDFVQKLLSLGPSIMVTNPPELRAMMVTRLRDTLALYEPAANEKPEKSPE